MWLFPYQRFFILTHLNSEDAIKELTNYVNPPPSGSYFKQWFSRNKFERYFSGTVKNNEFNIHRVVQGRNSFIPFIKCKIMGRDKGAMILVRMRVHPIVIAFCLWILISGWFFKSTFGNIVFTYEMPPLMFFLVLYGFALFSFKHAAKQDKEILLTIFKGEIEH